jgi:aspartyl-tRNA(Asn)/glutamyl-tRNA(Gln) amidotransferase subunit C
MKVSEQDVGHVADLAHLELSGEERARLLRDLNSILEYVARLNELDTSAVAPLAQVGGRGEAMRADVTLPSLEREAALGNAPETDGTFFKVPKVIEK